MVYIWDFVLNTFSSMESIYLDVIQWFSTEYEIGQLSFTVSELLFGVGLVGLLGFMIVKFLA